MDLLGDKAPRIIVNAVISAAHNLKKPAACARPVDALEGVVSEGTGTTQ
jgi:hypothetical protein